jgi:hypothetical protein
MTAKLALMLEARRRHGTLYRCGTRLTLWDGFICERGRLCFYWNSADGNTHMVWAASGSSFPAPLFISA